MSSFRPSGHASVRKNLEKIHPSVFARCRKLITMIYEGGSFRSALSSRIISSAHPHLPPGWYFFTPFLLKLITHIYIFHQRENSILQLQNLRILILILISLGSSSKYAKNSSNVETEFPKGRWGKKYRSPGGAGNFSIFGGIIIGARPRSSLRIGSKGETESTSRGNLNLQPG